MDDIVIIGGGIIGASTAYFLSKEGRKVRVFERDPTYKKASFPLSLGGFRRQFFQKENILLNLGNHAVRGGHPHFLHRLGLFPLPQAIRPGKRVSQALGQAAI